MKPFSLFNISERYGPYIFGVVSLLVIWKYVVGPEIERKNIDWDKHIQILESTKEIGEQNKETSRNIVTSSSNMRDTAVVLERATENLKGLSK